MAAAAVRMMMMVLICVATSRGVVDGQNSTSVLSTTTTPPASSNDRLPPMITINPSSITFPGTSVQLTCAATGTPTPTYTWKKNGVTLSLPTGNINQQSAGNILINPASSSDNGYYQCFASNQWGTAVSTVAYIQAASLGTFPTQSAANSMFKTTGDSLTVPCNGAPASIPAAQYSWSIQSITSSTSITQVYPSSRIQINSAGTLVFANVVGSDATPSGSVYRCSVYNSVMGTTVAGSNTTLGVSGTVLYSAPNWAFYSNPMSVVLGQTFTIDCFFFGNPTPVVSWSVPGGSLPTGRYTIDSTGTYLTIKDAQLTDAVAYQCMGNNSQGYQSVSINVKVNIAPNFTDATNGPANVNATNGDTVDFNCSFTANPTGQMSWYQNGQPLQANSLPAKYTLSPDQTVLTVTDVCKQCSDGSSDLTVIQCNVSNEVGYAYGQAYLNVLLPTTILSVTNNQTIGAGVSIDLNCQASSDPTTGINITWYFNSQQLQSTTYVPSSSSVTSTYVITGAQPSNQGAYTCLATNGYSYATADIGLLVTPAMVQSAADYWYIFMIIGLLIIFVIIAIIAFYCHWKNVGESYPVDNVEKKNGNDPVKDLQQSGFQDYQRPEGTTTATTGAAAYGTDQQYESNPDGVSVNFSQLDGQYGGTQYQANSALAAALAGKAALTDDDTFTTTGPKQIQLVGAGAPRYYYPEQPPASDGDLDAAFDDGSVAGTEQHPAQLQQQQQSPAYVGRAYAGSMPALADESMSTTWQLSAEDQRRRRLFGSVPTVLDDIARTLPNADARAGGGRFGVYAGAAVAGDDYHGNNNDEWMDDVPVRDESTRSPAPAPVVGYYDDMTMRRPGAVPPQPPPRRYTDVDDVDDPRRRQMASPTRFVVPTPLPRDDVFPVMYDDGAAGYPVGHDVVMDYADDDDGYDIDYNRIGGVMKQPHPAIRAAGINSPHNVSMPHTASESSV